MTSAADGARIRVLYCHGLESGPTGFKVRKLREGGGLEVVAPDLHMSLWNPFKTNSAIRSWLWRAPFSWPRHWGREALDESMRRCVSVMRAAICQPAQRLDVLVGSSWGGAVSAVLLADGIWQGPTILMCPALRIRATWVGASDSCLSTDAVTQRLAALPESVKSRCRLVHGTAAGTVPIEDSRALAEATGIQLIEIEGGSHGMGSMVLDGRLREFIELVSAPRASPRL